MKLVSNGWRAAMLAGLLAALSACEGGGRGFGPGPNPRVATSMTAATATSQTAAVASAVAEAPAVRVTDQRGAAMQGVAVTFAVSGGGTVANATATTDASGVASAGSWTLGAAAGANTVTASHGELSPVQFAATGQPRAATTVAAASATTQAAVAGTAVAQAPAVRVTDQTGALMQGVTVAFAVTAGGGTIATASAVTNAQGVASAGSWTLGAAGQNTVTATVGSIAPVAFNATSQARVATTLTTVSAATQTAVAGTLVPEPPAVRVDDQTGAPLAGVTVAFAVTAGGGVLTVTSAVTNASGIASSGGWILGAPGQNTVTATVGQGTVTFNATGQARVPAGLTATSDTDQAAAAGTAVSQAPRVRLVDQTGAPLVGWPVAFAVTAGGGTVTQSNPATDGNGMASAGTWTLGSTPGQNTVTATANGLSVAFQATGINPCGVATPYTVGSTVDGAWTAGDCIVGAGSRLDRYTVTITGDPVVFTLTSPTVDTYLALYDANNKIVAANNNDAGTNSAIRLLAPAGTYRLEASTYYTQDNLGGYQLTSAPFTPNTVGCREIAVLPPRTLTATAVAADCSFFGNADNYIVILQPGETLTARMESAQLDALLHLFDSRGSKVAGDNNGGGGTHALLTYKNNLGVPERYRLVADNNSATAEGEYTITITKN